MDEQKKDSIDLNSVAMMLIVHGGDAKSLSVEAIKAAEQNDIQLAEDKLKQADEALTKAHNSQSKLLSNEASGNNVPVSLLMVHAQDHLMNAITFHDLAKSFVRLYKNLNK